MKISGTVVFEKNWQALQSGKYKYIINSGSSRSSKTFSIIQIYWILAWSKANVKLAVFRNTKKDCKDTVLNDMLKYYSTLPYYNHVQFNKTESIFFFPNGSTINIEGTDDELKVHGYHSDYLWFNEFYRMPKTTFDQLDMRCSGCVFMDYNPVGRLWSDDLVKQDNAILIHSTFKDNPKIPIEQKRKILSYEPTPYNEAQKTADNYMWQVYGLGLKAEKPNRIFKNWEKITLEEWNNLPYNSYFGLDFGTTNPSALVEMKYADGCFFIRKRMYLPMSKMKQGNEFNSGGITKELEKLKINKSDIIIADSADKNNRLDISRNGYNIMPAKKGADSVISGINLINKFKVIYVEDDELEYEYENYEWEIVNGVNLDRPIKKDDHLLDAFRYVHSWLCNYLSIK